MTSGRVTLSCSGQPSCCAPPKSAGVRSRPCRYVPYGPPMTRMRSARRLVKQLDAVCRSVIGLVCYRIRIEVQASASRGQSPRGPHSLSPGRTTAQGNSDCSGRTSGWAWESCRSSASRSRSARASGVARTPPRGVAVAVGGSGVLVSGGGRRGRRFRRTRRDRRFRDRRRGVGVLSDTPAVRVDWGVPVRVPMTVAVAVARGRSVRAAAATSAIPLKPPAIRAPPGKGEDEEAECSAREKEDPVTVPAVVSADVRRGGASVVIATAADAKRACGTGARCGIGAL